MSRRALSRQARPTNQNCDLHRRRGRSGAGSEHSTSLQAQNPTDLGKLRIGRASEEAAGIPAIWNTMLYGIGEMVRFDKLF